MLTEAVRLIFRFMMQVVHFSRIREETIAVAGVSLEMEHIHTLPSTGQPRQGHPVKTRIMYKNEQNKKWYLYIAILTLI